MIGRVWHGWSTPKNADAYEALLRGEVLPGIHRVDGYHSAFLLRRDVGNEIEFMTITVFDDIDAVKRFAGEDFTKAVIAPGAEKLLTRYDERSVHYQLVMTPSG